tara:strand:+ start:974 stop:1201 length:228 start_codon:yes stop_codon:yes gene_type:complete
VDKKNWVKVSDVNGGTYKESEYYRERKSSNKRFHEREEDWCGSSCDTASIVLEKFLIIIKIGKMKKLFYRHLCQL